MSTSLVSLASLVQAFNPVTPQLRVAAIIVRQNQILLVEHRKRGQRYWVLPGGRLEGHETLDAALRRELKEELRLDARVGPPLVLIVVLTTLCRSSSRIPTFRPSSGCGSAGADTSPSQPSPAIPVTVRRATFA